MADVGKVYGVAIADLSRVYGIAVADLAKIVGLDVVTGGIAGLTTGGYSGSYESATERTTYATDTTATGPDALGTAVYWSAMLSDGSGTVYNAGGTDGTYRAFVDKWPVPTGTRSRLSGSLGTARNAHAGLSDRSTKGYWAGGLNGGGLATAEGVTFSSDAVAYVASADLTVNNSEHGASWASSVFGYPAIGGGAVGQQGLWKLTWSTETTSYVGANLPAGQGTQEGSAMSNADGKVYYGGGLRGSAQAWITEIATASDTASASGSVLSAGRRAMGSNTQSDGPNKGYWIAGLEAAAVATCDKITWATEAVAATSSADRQTGAAYGCTSASDVGY